MSLSKRNYRSLDTEQERRLLELLKMGDMEAFKEIFMLYSADLTAFAAASVPLDAAEDIVQDVFFNVWQRHSDIEITVPGLTPYLFAAVRNHMNRYERHRNVRKKYNHLIVFDAEDSESISVHAMDFSELDGAEDFASAYKILLSRLTEPQRAIVVLRWEQGLPYQEIAQILGISPNAATKQIARIREILKPVAIRLSK